MRVERNRDFILFRPLYFLSNWRSLPAYEMISYLLMYASVPLLAFGIQQVSYNLVIILILTILTMYSGFFAALIWNDITDADIDRTVHPDRPIPSGRISKKKFFGIALVFSALTVTFAALISIWCLLVVCCAAIFVALHDKYLKKIIKIPAYSEIFTPVQWVVVAIFGFVAIWSALPQTEIIFLNVPLLGTLLAEKNELINMIILVLFTYFADDAHDLPEGICDVDGDRKLGVRTYANSFGERNAARISFIMFLISGFLGFLLFVRTDLSLFFLVLFSLNWLYIIYFSFQLIKKRDGELKSFSEVVGRKGFNYLLISFDLIFLDILLQIFLKMIGI
jgi:geranylgeranylglycerol-phosphate geranylgeranyltransferase